MRNDPEQLLTRWQTDIGLILSEVKEISDNLIISEKNPKYFTGKVDQITPNISNIIFLAEHLNKTGDHLYKILKEYENRN